MENENNKDSVFGEVIYSYTSDEAENDGILVKLDEVLPEYSKGAFSHITSNLLSKGYESKITGVNILCLKDLLQQCARIVHKKYSEEEYFYTGMVETLNGDKIKVFIEKNETGRFTIMLPEDR